MTQSIESMGTPSLDPVELPTESLVPDEMNPNSLHEVLFSALRDDIEKRGFVQPVVVRPLDGGHWQIIDGEHRWRALRELKSETVPCVIDDAMPDEARLRMLTMNRLRGNFDGRKLGKLMVDLAHQMDEDELRERLGMPAEEHRAFLALAAAPDTEVGLREALQRQEAMTPTVISFRLTARNAKAVERVIRQITDEGRTRAEALIHLLQSGVQA